MSFFMSFFIRRFFPASLDWLSSMRRASKEQPICSCFQISTWGVPKAKSSPRWDHFRLIMPVAEKVWWHYDVLSSNFELDIEHPSLIHTQHTRLKNQKSPAFTLPELMQLQIHSKSTLTTLRLWPARPVLHPAHQCQGLQAALPGTGYKVMAGKIGSVQEISVSIPNSPCSTTKRWFDLASDWNRSGSVTSCWGALVRSHWNQFCSTFYATFCHWNHSKSIDRQAAALRAKASTDSLRLARLGCASSTSSGEGARSMGDIAVELREVGYASSLSFA